MVCRASTWRRPPSATRTMSASIVVTWRPRAGRRWQGLAGRPSSTWLGLDRGAAGERLAQAPCLGQEEAVGEHAQFDVFVTGWRIDALLANEAVEKGPQKVEQLDD